MNDISQLDEKLVAAFTNDFAELVSHNIQDETVTIDLDEDLENYGLDSISATEVVMALKDAYDIDVSPDVLFELETTRMIAQRVLLDHCETLSAAYSDALS